MLQPLQSDGKDPIPIEAFGQTWYFSPSVVDALKPYGIGSEASLEALVIDLTSINGIEEGLHEINYLGIDLRLLVRGSSILVEGFKHFP